MKNILSKFLALFNLGLIKLDEHEELKNNVKKLQKEAAAHSRIRKHARKFGHISTNELLPNYQKTVLIVTYGRSGSTLLQGVLNSMPDFCIRGENHNFFGSIQAVANAYASWEKLRRPEASLSTDPWFGSLFLPKRDIFMQRLLDFCLWNMFPTGGTYTTIGFKENRYYYQFAKADKQKLFTYLNFLFSFFRNTSFIVHKRNLADVAKSSWWAKRPQETVIEDLLRFEDIMEEYSSLHPERCYFTSHEDIVGCTDVAKGLYTFLGTTFDEQAYQKVLQTPHSRSWPTSANNVQC